MMKNKFLLTALIVFSVTNILWAQSKLMPSKRYSSGEVLYGAKTGVKSVVPQGWSGMLPRDSEVFLLLPEDGSNGEIYITASENLSEEQVKKNMIAGLELGNGNVLKSDGMIFTRGKSIASQIVLTQKTSDDKGYIETQCGPFGVCISATLFAAPQDFDKLQKSLYEFMDAISWVEPNLEADYGDFSWHEYLSGKHLLNYDYVPNAKAENDIWLCADGTFTTKLKRGGLLKDEVQSYKGTKKGTWTTLSTGQNGLLTLNYDKLPPLEVVLKIDEDRIFLNEKRHFVMKATVCK
jgi:hypothetical protein